MRLAAALPPFLLGRLRHIRNSYRYRGTERYCPICEKHSGKFLPFGVVKRDDAICPWCGSLERHRLVWLYFRMCTNLLNGISKQMLHVAPEVCLSERLALIVGRGYLTGDLMQPRVMVTLDIMNLPFRDETFEAIYCSHVLEHVRDDRQALREFRRVLKKNGWAVLLVPITAERGWEDPTVTSPEDRERLFGQIDHQRVYGPDYIDKLNEAGFEVTITTSADLASAGDIVRFGLSGNAAGEIYCCTRSAL